MYSLPRLRAHGSISLGAALAYLGLLALLVGGMIVLSLTGGEEPPLLDARATQAAEPAYPMAPAERSAVPATTDSLPEEMAPTF